MTLFVFIYVTIYSPVYEVIKMKKITVKRALSFRHKFRLAVACGIVTGGQKNKELRSYLAPVTMPQATAI